jgi:hypothetical protein
MGEFEDTAIKMRRLSAQLAYERDALPRVALDRGTLTGATYRPGDRVFDRVTGLEGEIVESRWAQVVFPPA